IGRLNRLTHRLMPGRMATALYLVLDLQTSALSFANAGHLPPLVMRADGATSFLDQGTAEPLGVLGHATYAPVEDTLGNGSTLVLCTDGLIERRSEGLEDGLARLRSLVADGPTAPSELCDHIIRDSLGPSGAEDDVALLVLRALPISSERMGLKLAADPDELANLRRVLGRWLHVIGASAEEAYDITVACTEASANAVEHAYSPEDATFEVEAAMRDGEVAVTVRDSGRWRPARGVHRGRGLQIMKSLMDEVEITPGEQGTTVQLRRRVSGKAS
ncbi:MAG: SpoIIE family protein phosphatase, partial [Actinomycetota bacterium]|nr:SpoIIE family protein phosphatase [Actinomycetota bacterium]